MKYCLMLLWGVCRLLRFGVGWVVIIICDYIGVCGSVYKGGVVWE